MLSFLSKSLRRNPYPTYAFMRKAAPVLHDRLHDLWMVFDYDSVRMAITDHEAFSSRAAAPGSDPLDWLIFSDQPRHTKLRSIIMKAFTPRAIASLEPRIRELSSELLDQSIANGEMDVVTDFSAVLPLLVIAEMLGIPLEDRPRFKLWSEAINSLSDTIWGGEIAAAALREHARARDQIREYLSKVLEERRASPKNDLLTRLVEAEVDGERLVEDEILSFFQLLLVAGSETTTNLISSMILCLIENRDQLESLRAEPELLPAAIEEVLRYRSPVQAVFRQTRRDVKVHGRIIPEGKLVLAVIGAANRDPRQFPNASRFDIERNPNPHIAFGHGIHFCLGASLARLESRIAISDFLCRVETFELADRRGWEPRKAFHVHGPSSLRIQFDRTE